MATRPAKGLKTLIRLAKFDVDEKRRVLAALQNREEAILADIAAADAQLEFERQAAAADPAGVGFIFSNFLQAWKGRRADLVRNLDMVRKEIEVARDDLAEAFRQQKSYEVTQANREKREREEEAHKEQIVLDEIGLTQFRRRHQDGGPG